MNVLEKIDMLIDATAIFPALAKESFNGRTLTLANAAEWASRKMRDDLVEIYVILANEEGEI